MGRPKGLPKTGGWAKGTKNRKTQIADAFADGALETAGKAMMPLAYMLKVMRQSRNKQDVCMEAAKAAAPYVHPKLAAVTLHGAGEDGSLTFNVKLIGADARA